MGFHTNLCGYRYLLSALCILWENPGQSLTKELYPAVAKLHKGSWQQIEHGIRLSIANAWERRSGDGWELYFSDEETKPTNSVFLTRMAQCMPGVAI
jgi:two-component system response regulator (stage 0 sporulation protein A)